MTTTTSTSTTCVLVAVTAAIMYCAAVHAPGAYGLPPPPPQLQQQHDPWWQPVAPPPQHHSTWPPLLTGSSSTSLSSDSSSSSGSSSASASSCSSGSSSSGSSSSGSSSSGSSSSGSSSCAASYANGHHRDDGHDAPSIILIASCAAGGALFVCGLVVFIMCRVRSASLLTSLIPAPTTPTTTATTGAAANPCAHHPLNHEGDDDDDSKNSDLDKGKTTMTPKTRTWIKATTMATYFQELLSTNATHHHNMRWWRWGQQILRSLGCGSNTINNRFIFSRVNISFKQLLSDLSFLSKKSTRK
ncbi:membrane-associated protein, putative [Bodo saltans]|uniref:Membrane-associated protein, putative n=1 Tax=Bodo saltans TaxID=75058 RepID=A0A0S4JRW8_BODSA|nr:membrane-associated protein, putative [Bodo saltans]|eukprot:CUG92066.1 membrane-associated protein, putative [Bodo saltans]